MVSVGQVLLGVCERCQGSSREELFLGWVVKVCSWLRQEHPNIMPIIWDDMIRNIPLPLLKGKEHLHFFFFGLTQCLFT